MNANTVQYRLQEVSKVYHLDGVDVHALRSVDLTIDRGELIVLLGPSGSGKSTLLNLLGGLDRPSTGTVHYGDEDLSKADDRTLTDAELASVRTECIDAVTLAHGAELRS